MLASSIGVAVVAMGRGPLSSLRHMSAGKKNVPPEPTTLRGDTAGALSTQRTYLGGELAIRLPNRSGANRSRPPTIATLICYAEAAA